MATWTNIHNLPGPLASAIRADGYRKRGDISATGLIRPPQMAELERIHDHEIVQDVADGVWRLLGQAVHSILERADTAHHLSEEALEAEVLGWKVTGRPDLLDQQGTLSDYKVTSTWSYIYSDKPEWEQQLNIYAWLYRKIGFQVKKLQIVAILRDWQSSKGGEEGYPPAAAVTIDVPLWGEKEQQTFVEDRVRLHQAKDKAECSAKERWERPTTYAVRKVGNVRAKRVFRDKAEADAFLVESGKGFEIEERPGEQIRCARYCTVSKWCPQAKALGVQSDG